MIARSTSTPSFHLSDTSLCTGEQLNAYHLAQIRQYRHASSAPMSPDMSIQRMTPRPAYAGPQSFPSEGNVNTPLEVDETALYPETRELLSESEMMPRSRKSNFPPTTFSIRSMSADRVRVLKTPRVRRRDKKDRGSNSRSNTRLNQIIDAPLSQLTKHMVNIPIKDMEAWANRSIEVRLKEVAEKKGKIARPMNSFMLYRSAYAERTKEWCAQNNHQVVSKVSGLSWPKEPPEIREKYEFLALIERDNHQKAHPEYKFAPNKTQTPPRNKKRSLGDESSEGDRADLQLPTRPSPVPNNKGAKSSGLHGCYDSRESTPLDSQEPILGDGYHQPAWQLQGGRSMPSHVFTHPDYPGFFMQPQGPISSMIRSPDAAHHPGPGLMNGQYSTSTSLVGIPGGVHQDLVRSYPGSHPVNQMENNQLDPQLLSPDASGADMRSYNRANFPGFWQTENDTGPYLSMPNALGTQSISYEHLANYTSAQTLDDGHNMWAAGGEDGVTEVGRDFVESWLQPSNATGYPSH